MRFALSQWLDALNRAHVRAHRSTVPQVFRGWMDEPTYIKSADYTLAKSRFGAWEDVYDTAVLMLLLATGLLAGIYELVHGWLGSGLWAGAFTLVLVAMIISLPSLPWEWAAQFRLEERFGFNKSTLKLWFTDKVKGMILGVILGTPLLAAILYCFKAFPETWWLWAAVTMIAFQLLMLVLYPMLIVPLFNKLSPLPEGELKDRLLALGERAGFRAKTIQVIDGSKRSGHSNAYFTGFGKFRRIVLYDTLIEQLSPEELEAVLAHEIGHYKRGHIPKMLAVASGSILLAFWLLHLIMQQKVFYTAFGFSTDAGVVPALLLFSLLSPVVTFWLGPLMNRLSRKHEYEADAFAREHTGGADALVGSLRKLHEKNLSNLNPHPFYSAFYYSHPTLIERERALEQGNV